MVSSFRLAAKVKDQGHQTQPL